MIREAHDRRADRCRPPAARRRPGRWRGSHGRAGPASRPETTTSKVVAGPPCGTNQWILSRSEHIVDTCADPGDIIAGRADHHRLALVAEPVEIAHPEGAGDDHMRRDHVPVAVRRDHIVRGEIEQGDAVVQPARRPVRVEEADEALARIVAGGLAGRSHPRPADLGHQLGDIDRRRPAARPPAPIAGRLIVPPASARAISSWLSIQRRTVPRRAGACARASPQQGEGREGGQDGRAAARGG